MKIKDLIVDVQKLGKAEVKVGWFSENKYQDGTSVAQVAAWNEFGHTTRFKKGGMRAEAVFVTPARPFMRAAAANLPRKINKVAQKVSDVGQLLPLIGEIAVGEILTQIKSGGWQENSPLTVNGLSPLWKGKGFDKPLTDTGVMAQTVQYKVIKGGES